jgi:hypothetical protein
MKQEIERGGHEVTFVAINAAHAAASQQELIARTTFDLLQDVPAVNAWALMGGGQDDFFIYRQGGTLGRYISAASIADIDLSTAQGYGNVKNAILGVLATGPGPSCTPSGPQVPGDISQDGKLDLADPISFLGLLFGGSPASFLCPAGADANGDAEWNITDPIYLLNYLFRGGPPPAAGRECVPFEGCPEACAGAV